MLVALYAAPLVCLGLCAGLSAWRRPELLVLTGHALLSLVAGWVHSANYGGRTGNVLLALASTPAIAVLLGVGIMRPRKNMNTSSNSLRPAPIYRFLTSLRPTSLRWSLLATVPVIALSLLLALVAPVANVMALNAVLVALHTSVWAYSAPLPGFWPFTPVSSPVLPQEEDKISSEKSLRERQTEDWVGQFDDTRQQVVDEWSLSFTTAATAPSRRRSGSTQSGPMRLATRLYSPVKARLLRMQDSGFDDTFGHSTTATTGPSTSGVYDTAKSTDNTYATAQSKASKASKASKTSEHSVRFARPLSPTPKAARLGFDESDMSAPAPLRLPPLAKVASAPSDRRSMPSTPPRAPHNPVHSTENGTPTSWLSSPGSPGQSSILHPDWSFSSCGSDPAAFLSSTVLRPSLDTRRSLDRRSLDTSRLSVDGYSQRKSLSLDLPREPPYAFLSQDPAPKRKRGSTQTAASVSFHDYVSVHSAHSTSRQKLSDAPGTVRRLSCPASIAESFNASVGGSILGDYSASPSQPLPRSFESLRSFRTRTQSKSSYEPEADTGGRWEVVPESELPGFVPAELFKERVSDDVPSFFVDIVEEQVEERWSLGWPGVLGSLLLLGLSSPALLADGIATRALLLASSFIPALVITTSSILSPREVQVDIEAEQKRTKYNPRDRSMRPSHGKLLRARPELSFAPPSPLKSRPRTMSAAARLRTLRGGIVSAMAPAMGHCASDSVGSTGTHDTQASTRSQAAEADGSHGWLDAHIGVATVATRSRSPSVLKLDWTGIASAPTTPARKTMTPRKSPAKIGTPKKIKDSDEEEEEDDVLAAASAVAPSPSRVQRRRTSAFATSGCDFSLPSSGYAPSLRGSLTGAAAAAQRALPKRAPLNRVVTCPVSKASAPAPRLPKSSDASGGSSSSAATSDAPHTASSSDTFGTKAASAASASASAVDFSTYDFSIPRQISGSSEGEGIGRAVLGFNIPPPTTPMPPAPSVPAAPLALAPRNMSAEKIDLYSTPARRAKSSETSSIHRNAELARLLLSEGTPAPARHKRSFSGGSVRSHPYSASRSARSSRSTKSSKGSKGPKCSASWASIKASLKSSVPSPLTPKFRPCETNRPSTPSTIARLESSLEDQHPAPPPRSHPHPRPFSFDYATPWDHAPLRTRAPHTRPVPDVGSSYEVSSRENTRLHTTKRSKSEAAFVKHLDKSEKGLRPLVLAERHANDPVKRSPRFGRTPSVSGISGLSDETEDEVSYFDVSSSLKPGIKAFVTRLSGTPSGTPDKSAKRESGASASASQRTSIFGLGNIWNSSVSGVSGVSGEGSVGAAMNSPNVRAGRGRDTSPVRRARSPVGPKPKPKPMRL